MKVQSLMAMGLAVALSACGGDKPAESKSEVKADKSSEQRVIRVATEGAYPPFNDLAADGKLVGFDVNVMNALCAKMNAKCEIVAQDWDGILPGLMTEKYDAVIAGMSITPERLEKVDFSEPYFANTMVWLAKNDGSFDPNAVKNKVLGGQRSTTGASYISEKYDGKDGNTVQLYDSYINAYLDLKAGRNDAVMAEKVSANDWLNSGNNAGFGLVGEEIDNNDNLGIAVRKGDPLKAEFDKALAELKASGELAKLEAEVFAKQEAKVEMAKEETAKQEPAKDAPAEEAKKEADKAETDKKDIK